MLRGYNNNYKICRRAQKPTMFRGLPLYLAIVYLIVFLIGIMSGIILASNKAPIIISVLVPILIIFGIGTGIKNFYNRYGIYGWNLSQRDKNLPNTISSDKTIVQLLKRNHNG